MKIFLFLTLNLMVAMTAQASSFVCLETVEAAVTQEFEEKGWSYHGADPYTAEELTAMLGNLEEWSTELFQEEADEIAGYLSQGKYEFYSVTGTGDYSGGFQELIVVDPNDQCGLVARYLTYVE